MSAALGMQHRMSRARALREALRDGQWHYGTELALRVGHRFGGALRIIRLGDDGEPAWLVEREQREDDGSVHRYRFVGINPSPPVAGGSWKGRALLAERRVLELEAEIRSLRARLIPEQGRLFS